MNWRLFFSLTGRINRAPYWLVTIFNVFVFMGLLVAAWVFSWGLLFAVAAIAFIPLLISSFAIMIKRLHDRNKSGWWVLFFYVLPIILGGMQNALRTIPDTIAIFLGSTCTVLGAIISIWMLVELGFLRGTAGPNRYGPDPLA